MTRVYGQLFEDGRDGFLIVKPSKPFFGVSRHERRYPIVEGQIDIELQPTPSGYFYNLGYKEEGDITRSDFTLRLRVPRAPELDISPTPQRQPAPPSSSATNAKALTQIKRLAIDLENAQQTIKEKESKISDLEDTIKQYKSKFDALKVNTAVQLEESLCELREARSQNQPKEVIVEKQVPVADEQLKRRISQLERKLSEMSDLNAVYYLSVLELNEIKLERARTAEEPPIPVVEARPTDPRSILLEKIRGN